MRSTPISKIEEDLDIYGPVQRRITERTSDLYVALRAILNGDGYTCATYLPVYSFMFRRDLPF